MVVVQKRKKPEITDQDLRPLEDVWKQAFPVGTEWGQFQLLSEYSWTFSNLLDEFKDGGVLHGEKVFLFSCIEPQLLYFGGEYKVVRIPSVAAIVAPFPPSDKIGVKYLHMESEEIIDMKNINMGWVPYNIPLGKRTQRLSPQIFLLSRVQTEAAFELDPSFQYGEPYFKNPFKLDETKQCSIVNIKYLTGAGLPIITALDWKLDEVEDLTAELVAKGKLPKNEKDAFKAFVENKVEQGKTAVHEAMEKRIQAQEELMAEGKADAVQNMRFYKFYPVATPDTPVGYKAKFINKYYGKAHQVF